MSPLFFDDFLVGASYKTTERTVTETDVVRFEELSGDRNPLHFDEQFAKKSRFGRKIVPGMLTLAILTGLWDKLGILSGSAEALSGMDNLKFIRPVFLGDTIHATIRVIDKKEGKDNGMVTLSNEIINQREESILICNTRLIVKRRRS